MDDLEKELKFSVEYMDKSIDPFKDFYTFANGKWLERYEIPPDKVRYEAFSILYDRNQKLLGKICEEASTKKDPNYEEKIVGDFYKSAMNTDLIDKIKFQPVEKIISEIQELNDRSKIPDVMANLLMQGFSLFFDIGTEPDAKNSNIYGFYMGQSGLSLPDREYYLNSNFKGILNEYKKYVKNIFGYYGLENPEMAVNDVLEIEMELAGASRPREELRDPEKNYNKMELEDLKNKFTGLNLLRFLRFINMPSDYVIIGQPEFFERVSQIIENFDIKKIRHYMIWNVLNQSAPFLHREVRDENFRFYKQILLGQEKQEDRWKIAVKVIDASIGEALGKLYVEKYFGENARKKMEIMVNDIKDAFSERLKNVKWMGDETKSRALNKFSRFTTKIGYPEKFRDYKGLLIRPDDYFGNVFRSEIFEINRQINRSGKAVDHTEWEMTPPTVNAYFNPLANEIVFPAGILQPPFFDPDMDDPVNYGGIGGIIAHEITHGYDDEGRHFDENGNLTDWWTREDEDAFNNIANKIAELYGSLEILPGLKVNGRLTLGENIADIGGVTIAYAALKKHLGKHPELRKNIDGFTPEQRFFIAWSQVWRGKIRENEIKRLITIDPHAPARFRGEIPVWNHPDFEMVFNGYNKENRKHEKIIIW